MPLETYFVEGEKILTQAGIFYATNKRLLRYKKHPTGEELDDIPYSHITSIGIVRSTRRGLIKPGLILAAIGISLLVTLIAVRPALRSITSMLSNLPGAGNLPGVPGIPLIGFDLASMIDPLLPLSVITLAIGILLAALGIFWPQVFVQFRASGLNAETEAKFRLDGVKKDESIKLVRTIRQMSLSQGPGEGLVRPAENKGNQTPG